MDSTSQARRRLLVACLATVSTLAGCADSEQGRRTDTSSAVVPSHDMALYYIRDCDWEEARIMAERAAAEVLPEVEGAALVRHIEQLILLADVGRRYPTGGPIADGCVARLFGAPYRDLAPAFPWRAPSDVQMITDSLAVLEAAGASFEPVYPPSEQPRYTYEIAALFCGLDQYDRVNTLLASIPERARHRFWHPYLTAITTVRREVNADWRNLDACTEAASTLSGLLEAFETDREVAAMAPVVLFNLGMIERHRRRPQLARSYVERAFAHVETRGAIRDFLTITWGRM
jgi:hypothetical protein